MNEVQALIVVAIRLWCASAIITGLTSFPSAFLFSDQLINATGTVYVMATSTTWFAVGSIGWFVAPKLVVNLIKTTKDQAVSFKIDPELIVLCGCFLIGWFYLIRYVPQLISQVAIVTLEKESVEANTPYGIATRSFSWTDWEPIIKSACVVTVALWMTFRPQHIARLFAYIRSVGV